MYCQIVSLLLTLWACFRVDFNVPMKNGAITSNQRYVVLTVIQNILQKYTTLWRMRLRYEVWSYNESLAPVHLITAELKYIFALTTNSSIYILLACWIYTFNSQRLSHWFFCQILRIIYVSFAWFYVRVCIFLIIMTVMMTMLMTMINITMVFKQWLVSL